MCERPGLAFNKPISPGLSFRGFQHRAKRNRDGWGLAAITPTKARIIKEAVRAKQSDVSGTSRNGEGAAGSMVGSVRPRGTTLVRAPNMAPPELTEYGTPVHLRPSAAKTAARCQHIASDIYFQCLRTSSESRSSGCTVA
jgi:hypothetical protein